VNYWPLLDIREAVQDCDRNLADIVLYVETLQQESQGHHPPAGDLLLANVAAMRELLGGLIPPALEVAIRDEETLYTEEEARWEPNSSSP
jgi:hypothetical protein